MDEFAIPKDLDLEPEPMFLWDEIDEHGKFDERGGYLSDDDWADSQ